MVIKETFKRHEKYKLLTVLHKICTDLGWGLIIGWLRELVFYTKLTKTKWVEEEDYRTMKWQKYIFWYHSS